MKRNSMPGVALNRTRSPGAGRKCSGMVYSYLRLKTPFLAYLILSAVAGIFFTSCTGGSSGQSQVYFVSSAAGPEGDGMSWETALLHPQDALDAAESGDQIWVAEGQYGPRDAGDRNVIALKTGVQVLGGFRGSESDVSERNPDAFQTTLNGLGYVYHVVSAVNVERGLIDGFTVTGGKALGLSNSAQSGGGVLNVSSSIEIRQCRFIENSASFNGGAIYSEGSDIVLTDSVLEMNSANFGGAVGNYNSTSTIISTRFTGNRSSTSGGAVYNMNSSANLVNAIFSGNSTSGTGGAVLSNSSDTVFTNCTFNGNRCRLDPGGAGGAVSLYEGQALFINCVLWGDRAQCYPEIFSKNGQVEIRYSIVEGMENINLDPGFIQEGFWDETDNWIDGDYRLSDGSPGIDSGTAAGAPNFDLAGKLRPQELAHDRGAYEHSGE